MTVSASFTHSEQEAMKHGAKLEVSIAKVIKGGGGVEWTEATTDTQGQTTQLQATVNVGLAVTQNVPAHSNCTTTVTAKTATMMYRQPYGVSAGLACTTAAQWAPSLGASAAVHVMRMRHM
jgi:hypothetical protein